MNICQNTRRWDYRADRGCALLVSLVSLIHCSSHDSRPAVQGVDRSEDGGEGKVKVNKKNFVVNVLPKFAKSIASSKQVSGIVFLRESVLVVKGRSHFLLRAPQKKRTKLEETKEVIASYDSQDLKVVELEQEVEALKQNLEDFKDLQSEHAKYKSIIADLKQRGIINEHGDERITF